jgi:tetratricopeptide (TPR) repeat protein
MQGAIWLRAGEILDTLLDLPEARRREELQALGLDEELRRCVERLLAGHARSGLLDAPLGAPPGAGVERRLGRWRLQDEIGRGGSGVVFRAIAHDADVEIVAAIKVLPFATLAGDGSGRFRSEQAILARLNHPHIVPLIDGGVEADGTPWFAMPLVRGQPIDAWCDGTDAGVRDLVERFVDVCDAVAYAHQNLVVHRDLKPSNVWVDDTGHVRLLDFGIARLLDEGAESTATGLRALTPEYAAPEQFRGAPASTSADVYGLGALLYRLLTQRTVRTRDGDPSIVPPPPSAQLERQRDPGRARLVRGDLDAIVLKALAPEPQQRYPAAVALADDLRRWLAGAAVQARAPSLLYLSTRFVARHRAGVAAVLAIIGALTWGLVSTQQQAERARREATRAATVQGLLLDLFGAADPELRDRPVTDVRQLLAEWPVRVGASLEGDPLLHAELLLVAGGARARLGDAAEARALIEAALDRMRQTEGADLLRGRAARELAEVEASVSHFPRAREHLDAAIESLGRVPEDGARLLLFHALLQRATMSHYFPGSKPEADIERARALLPSLPAGDPWPEARLLYLQGRKLQFAGKYDEALRSLEQAQALVGDDSPRSFAILSEIGQLLMWRGRLEEAVAASEHARDLALRHFRPDSARVSMALSNLGGVLERVGRPADAEAPLREALQIQRGNADEDPTTQSYLARVLRLLGRLDEAASLHERAYEGHRAEFGEAHVATVNELIRGARVQFDLGHDDQGWQRMTRAVELAAGMQARGQSVWTLTSALQEQACYAVRLKRFADALALFERALRVDPDDQTFVYCQVRAYLESGATAAADAIAHQLRARALDVPAHFAENRAALLVTLIRVELAAGHRDAARQVLQRALERSRGVALPGLTRDGMSIAGELAVLSAELQAAPPPAPAARPPGA